MRVEISVPDHPFMGYEDAAAFCAMSVDSLRRSDCPRCHVGGRVVFFAADLVQFTLSRRRPPLDPATVIEIKVTPRMEARAA
jgi:hypothetical protein